MPPVLFIHGTADKGVPHEQSTAMCGRMKAAGARCEVLLIDGAPHGVENWEKEQAWQIWKPRVVEWLRHELRK
jgi:dipeptidyl aminopeptidase/acylaminoacyl peptidase